MRPKPSARVVAWIAKQRAAELCTTSITEAEIFYGIELLGKSKRREGMLAAAEAMFTEDLGGRIFGPSSQRATLQTSRTVVSMSLILGVVREPVA
jgi:hypothetical protein